MSESLLQAFSGVLGDLRVLLIIVAAAIYGIFLGAVPGLTATMAVALLVPATFFLDPIPALAAVVTVEACAIFAGDIPNALLRIPGTPASAAYADDVYAFTRAGRSAEVLGVCLAFSVAGGETLEMYTEAAVAKPRRVRCPAPCAVIRARPSRPGRSTSSGSRRTSGW